MSFKTSDLQCCAFRFADEYREVKLQTCHWNQSSVDFTIQTGSEVLSSYRIHTLNKKTKITKFSPLLYHSEVDSSAMSKPGLKTNMLEALV